LNDFMYFSQVNRVWAVAPSPRNQTAPPERAEV